MADTAAITVVGAGVIGLATAFRLVRNHADVVLIDRSKPGMQASLGNAGHIATEQVFPLASPATICSAPRLLLGQNGPLSIRPQYALSIAPWLSRFALAARPSAFRQGTAALTALQARAMDSMAALCADAGVKQLLHQRGHLILVESVYSKAAAMAQLERFREHGIAVRWLDADNVTEMAPDLPHDICGALYLENTGHVTDPLLLSDGLHRAFTEAGGRTLQSAVRDIEVNGDGTFTLHTESGQVHSNKVVIAAGAWSGPFAKQLGSPVPLDTERGYNVTADGFRPQFDVSIASFERMTIMTPMECGLRITGFVEFGGLQLPPDKNSLRKLENHLTELLPRSDMREFSQWMGFRPSLPDHLPVIGESPKHRNAFFAFGHQHLGLTLAGITADMLSELVAGRESPVDPHPYRAERF